MPSFRQIVVALAALALCGAPLSASAQSFTDTQRGDIETIVPNYLLAHPEVTEGRSIAALFIAREYLAGRFQPKV